MPNVIRYCNSCRGIVQVANDESGFTAAHQAPICKAWQALEHNIGGLRTMTVIYGSTREDEYEPASSVGR